MATVIPDNPGAQIEFFTVHAPGWVADPEAIGLTPDVAADVAELAARAFAARAEAQRAREAAKSATFAWRDAARKLREVGGSAVRTIKAFAEASDDNRIYAAAAISVPERTGPKARSPEERDNAVPRVRSCKARPDSHGDVVVEWTCGRGETMGAGAGMVYKVQRSIDNGPLTLLDVVGSPGAGKRTSSFTDTTVPQGTRTVGYIVTPIRGGGVGSPGPMAWVQFGSRRIAARRENGPAAEVGVQRAAA